jgi:3-hydroxymyristoyl/3-hydroxydecanoyl-(acyl carrier protein) dehydratase
METTVHIEPTVEYIKGLVPLRFPVLLVDRVMEWTPGEHIVAIKCFTANESCFGTSVSNLNRPAEAMMVESMVQVAGLTLPKRPGKYVYLLGLDNVEIHRRVEFGDIVVTTARKLWLRANMFRIRAESKVDGEPAISGDITYGYLDAAD